MKYQKRLAGKVASNKKFQAKQKKLRKKYAKYHIEDGIIRIEKKRFLEIVIKSLSGIIRVTVNIVLIGLATIGALALLYPDTRQAMYVLAMDLYGQAIKLLTA